MSIDGTSRDIPRATPLLTGDWRLDAAIDGAQSAGLAVEDSELGRGSPSFAAIRHERLLRLEAREVVERAAPVTGGMRLANIAAFAHVNHSRWIVRDQGSVEFVALAGAVHEDVYMRVPPRHVRVPHPQGDESLVATSASSSPGCG